MRSSTVNGTPRSYNLTATNQKNSNWHCPFSSFPLHLKYASDSKKNSDQQSWTQSTALSVQLASRFLHSEVKIPTKPL